MKVVVFYSPQGGGGKTTLAYACALLCARKQTTFQKNHGFVRRHVRIIPVILKNRQNGYIP